MADLIDVVVPARLVLRALDDLHALGQAARTLPQIEDRFLERLDGFQARTDAMLAMGNRMQEMSVSMLDMGERMYAQGQQMFPIAQRLADTAGPLQGASERLGRIVDLLPGARGKAE
jgi:hypothetical protein